jgi:hypothetical protein
LKKMTCSLTSIESAKGKKIQLNSQLQKTLLAFIWAIPVLPAPRQGGTTKRTQESVLFAGGY